MCGVTTPFVLSQTDDQGTSIRSQLAGILVLLSSTPTTDRHMTSFISDKTTQTTLVSMQKKYYTHFEKHYTHLFYKHNFSKDAKAPNLQQNKHNAKHIPSL